ncbi:dUTP diphosphatase [[Clostridium] polysaccharolyticum]|uniref:dUTP diphosphatase n=1 Tax=[Clostridium] polysaccharolyticum TaxID=29364 RepID=A0A1I0FFD4_9FIRM|nr:dUTP diphosphatase [[Clostridium] polysaccharolyticum]SET56893.1 dUTP pyrophosphatase [[Clostridium] polysaccharolyticum]
MKINVKRLTETATIPTRGSEHAAGYDLYADIQEPVVIKPNENCKIGTGLAFEIPEGYFGAIFARSGMAAKQSLRPANCVGVCDSDYRGEYIVALHNDSSDEKVVNPKDRIAQLVVMPYLVVEFDEVEELDETRRGTGGFGSTGK